MDAIGAIIIDNEEIIEKDLFFLHEKDEV